MKKAICLIITLLCVCCFSCTEETSDDSEREICNNYIQSYYDGIDSIEVIIPPTSNGQSFDIQFYSDNICMYKRNYSDEKQRRFNELAKLYNDTAYNHYDSFPYIFTAVSDTIFNIEVISDYDYDENHKAGDDIGDLITFYCSSPYQFIQNGYKETLGKTQTQLMKDNNIITLFETIECPLTNINDVLPKMLDCHCTMLFNRTPIKRGTYTFTINMYVSQKCLSTKFEINF